MQTYEYAIKEFVDDLKSTKFNDFLKNYDNNTTKWLNEMGSLGWCMMSAQINQTRDHVVRTFIFMRPKKS